MEEDFSRASKDTQEDEGSKYPRIIQPRWPHRGITDAKDLPVSS